MREFYEHPIKKDEKNNQKKDIEKLQEKALLEKIEKLVNKIVKGVFTEEFFPNLSKIDEQTTKFNNTKKGY